jgi:regulator of replication initiation timing
MPTMLSNDPLRVSNTFTNGGVPFTGLLFLRPIYGQSPLSECCGGCGDCLAVSFTNGFFTSAALVGGAICPADFQTLTTVNLASTTGSGLYGVGYRHGNPADLLAAMPEAGCCYSSELTVPDEPTWQWAAIPAYSEPNGQLKQDYSEAIAAVEALSALQTRTATALNLANDSANDLRAKLLAANANLTTATAENRRLKAENRRLMSQLNRITPAQEQEAADSVRDEIAKLNNLVPVLPQAIEFCAETYSDADCCDWLSGENSGGAYLGD